MTEITRILSSIEAGNPQAAEELLPVVYEELRHLAASKMAREPAGQTLQATALVHEAWMALGSGDDPLWNSRNHFFKAAAEAMRRILIDRARRRKRIKHGGEYRRIPLEELELAEQSDPETLEWIDNALTKLAQRDPEKAELVKLRFFAGLNNREIAALLNLSVPTVKRRWAVARAWMFDELSKTRL